MCESKNNGASGNYSLFASLVVGGLFGFYLSNASALDFKEAYQAAFVNDPNVRAARAESVATKENLPQAISQRLPSVSLNAGRNYNDLTSKTRNFLGQSTKTQDNYLSGSQNLSVRLPIYRPQIDAQIRQAEARVNDADFSLEKNEQLLVSRVAEAYFDALLAQDRLSLIEIQKSAATAQLDAAKKRFDKGAGNRIDVEEALAQLDVATAQELELRQAAEYNKRRLELILGVSVEDIAKLNVAKFQPSNINILTAEEWISLADRASPEMASLRAQVEVSREEIEKAQAGHKPTLDLVAQWSRSNSDSVTSVNSKYDNKIVGLQLTVPIYSGGYVSSTVRQAVAAHERARELMEAARRELEVKVQKEFRGVSEGAARIRAFEQAARSAEQVVLSNRRSFELGLRTSLDVLNSEQKKVSALQDLAQARYQYLVSFLRLRTLAGENREQTVEQINQLLIP